MRSSFAGVAITRSIFHEMTSIQLATAGGPALEGDDKRSRGSVGQGDRPALLFKSPAGFGGLGNGLSQLTRVLNVRVSKAGVIRREEAG